ncbi:MAG: phosphatase PAP2 family protein [DPANN group archaeon]|nr:phosphatase PAP2 family protein [DPANN group archaeon]
MRKSLDKALVARDVLIGAVIASILVLATSNFDELLVRLITENQAPLLNPVMALISDLMVIHVGIPLILVFVYLADGKEKRMFWNTITALALAMATALVLKELVSRPRPYLVFGINNLRTELLSSFPSGHAANSFSIMGILAYHKRPQALFFLLFAAIVAYSRVYLGVHYVSDVLAGALIGMLWARVVFAHDLGLRMKKSISKLMRQ